MGLLWRLKNKEFNLQNVVCMEYWMKLDQIIQNLNEMSNWGFFCGRVWSTTAAKSTIKQVVQKTKKTCGSTQRIFLNPSDLGFSSFNRQTSFYKAIKAFDPKFSHIAAQGGSQGIDGHGTIDTSAGVVRKSSQGGGFCLKQLGRSSTPKKNHEFTVLTKFVLKCRSIFFPCMDGIGNGWEMLNSAWDATVVCIKCGLRVGGTMPMHFESSWPLKWS